MQRRGTGGGQGRQQTIRSVQASGRYVHSAAAVAFFPRVLRIRRAVICVSEHEQPVGRTADCGGKGGTNTEQSEQVAELVAF